TLLVQIAQLHAGDAIQRLLHLRLAVLRLIQHGPILALPSLATELPAHSLQAGARLTQWVTPAAAGQFQGRTVEVFAEQSSAGVTKGVARGPGLHLQDIAL